MRTTRWRRITQIVICSLRRSRDAATHHVDGDEDVYEGKNGAVYAQRQTASQAQLEAAAAAAHRHWFRVRWRSVPAKSSVSRRVNASGRTRRRRRALAGEPACVPHPARGASCALLATHRRGRRRRLAAAKDQQRGTRARVTLPPPP